MTGGGAGTAGGFFFIISKRSNSLVAGRAAERGWETGVFMGGGIGAAGVIAPSLITGCCGVAFDHPWFEGGLGGCGAGAATFLFDASGVPLIFGIAVNVSEIIFGPGGPGGAAGLGVVGVTGADVT